MNPQATNAQEMNVNPNATAGYATLFWQFDPRELAKMHAAEYEYRRTWLENKVAGCEKKLAEGILSPKLRVAVLEDMVMYNDILRIMYQRDERLAEVVRMDGKEAGHAH